jgi:hypothetical protein
VDTSTIFLLSFLTFLAWPQQCCPALYALSSSVVVVGEPLFFVFLAVLSALTAEFYDMIYDTWYLVPQLPPPPHHRFFNLLFRAGTLRAACAFRFVLRNRRVQGPYRIL